MEENTFIDQNPQFSTFINGGTAEDWYAHQQYTQARNSEIESSGIARWFQPGISEAAQFDRENYMMDKENAFNEYMWNKSNEYNSAEAQMERAKAAGINPALMAAGISGIGGNQAMPMQGATGQVGANTNSINPIETLATIAGTAQTGIEATKGLGELFGFGEKNIADIKLINRNAEKAAAEMEFTKQQTHQLKQIGKILVDNAKLEGNQIEQNIKNLIKLNEVYEQQKWNIAADTNQKVAETGQINENTKSIQYENDKKAFEKAFRDLFGMELTHDQLSLLVEACLNGHGKEIINYLTDNIAGAIEGIKDAIKETDKKDKEFRNSIGEKSYNIGHSIRKYFNRRKFYDDYVKLPIQTKDSLRKKGIDGYEYVKIQLMLHGLNGASGKW